MRDNLLRLSLALLGILAVVVAANCGKHTSGYDPVDSSIGDVDATRKNPVVKPVGSIDAGITDASVSPYDATLDSGIDTGSDAGTCHRHDHHHGGQ